MGIEGALPVATACCGRMHRPDVKDEETLIYGRLSMNWTGRISMKLGLAVALAAASPAGAQNGTNYHVLHNGLDVVYAGVGAGGSQTRKDGLGTWVAGEDMRGSHITVLGDFGYRMSQCRECACVLGPPIGGGPLEINFRGIVLTEMDGLNANNQAIFLNPACTTPSFPLGTSGFIPYGVGPGSSFSFVLAPLPAGVGPAPSSVILLPNNGLVPSSSGGSATIVAAVSNFSVGIGSSGFCWGVQFTWLPSAVPFLDDIDGLWHYLLNSDDGNQYWCFSNDEMNIWQSNSVATDGGLNAHIVFTANVDYTLLPATVEPNTIASLAPRGTNLTGPYYTQTENVRNENGVALNPNSGFDVGRGSAAISFSGMAGVPNPATGLGNQNASNNPGTLTTLGFATWDNGPNAGPIGSVRLTWLSIDFLGFARGNPAAEPGVTKFGGQIRLPVVSAGLLQSFTTKIGFVLFGHVTGIPAGGPWPDPDGFGGAAPFGVTAVGGASWQFPTGPQPGACVGTKLNITYGTTGRTGVLGAPGGLTYDPAIADISGSKELYLFD
jgi:hypothetical protein